MMYLRTRTDKREQRQHQHEHQHFATHSFLRADRLFSSLT